MRNIVFVMLAAMLVWWGSAEPKQHDERGVPQGLVTFSKPSACFWERVTVGIRKTGDKGVIRYTVDGTEPRATSPQYDVPLEFKRTRRLKAAVFEGGTRLGPVCQGDYFRLHPDLRNARAILPVLVIANQGDGMPRGNESQVVFWGLIEPGAGASRERGLGQRFVQSGLCRIKRRGSSSRRWAKPSFSVNMQNSDGSKHEVSLLGLPADSDWVFGGRYRYDRSLIRNDLIYRLSRELGVYAPRTRLVEVFFNAEGSGILDLRTCYLGVYSLTEKIKRGKERVEMSKLRDDGDKAQADRLIFKKDYVGPGERGFEIEGMGRVVWVYPKEKKHSAKQEDLLRNHFGKLRSALAMGEQGESQGGEHYRDLIDEESWIANHWLTVLAKNVDGFRASHYYHTRPYQDGFKVHAGPVWDFDRSMGSVDGRDRDPTGWNGEKGRVRAWDDSSLPILMTLLQQPDFRQKHTDFWFQHREEVLSWSHIESLIDEYAVLLNEAPPGARSAVQRNFAKWGQVSPRGGQYLTEIRLLKDWLKRRLEWIDAQYVLPPHFIPRSRIVEEGEEIRFQPDEPDCTFYYTVDGSDPRAPGGKVSQRAKTDQHLRISESTTVIARYKRGDGLTAWSAPIRRNYIVGMPASAVNLALVKIHAQPEPPQSEHEKAVSQDASDFEYLELKNTGKEVIQLTGARFVDGVCFDFSRALVSRIESGGSFYLVRNYKAFKARYGEEKTARVVGEYGPYRLDNKGEVLEMIDFRGETIFRKEF